MNLPVILSLLGSFSMMMIVAGLSSIRPRTTLWQRVEHYEASTSVPTTLEELELQEAFSRRVLLPLLLRGIQVTGRILPNKRLALLRQRLQMAGEPGGLTAAQFVGLKIWLTIALAGLAVLRISFGPKPNLLIVTACVLFIWLGSRLPDIWLSRRIKLRQLDLTHSMPGALDMLTIAVEAGLSFEQSIGEIGLRWQNELSREFRRVLYELSVGTARREALEHLRDRTGVSDIASFVVAINHSEELGTSLARVLSVQSQEMRTRRRQRAQEMANKVPVKMMFPLVFFIFPSMFAVILGPAVPRLVHAFRGLMH